VEEQDKIEAEDTDVEGHKHVISRTKDAADDAAEGRTRHASDEADSDDPDVEAHRLVPPKVVPPRTVN
jgi:hypothetical protein